MTSRVSGAAASVGAQYSLQDGVPVTMTIFQSASVRSGVVSAEMRQPSGTPAVKLIRSIVPAG